MTKILILNFSIFAQVNITNPTSWLVKFDVKSNLTLEKILKSIEGHRMEIVWTFNGNRMDFDDP
jgi:hypothetical protein